MKLLFDQSLSYKLCRSLADLFPDSLQVRRLSEADGRAVGGYAAAHGFVVVSLDADFAEMATLFGPTPKLIWLRCGNQTTAIIEALLRNHAGAIATFEHDDAVCLEIY